MVRRMLAGIIVVGMGIGTIGELTRCYADEVSIPKINEPELAAELQKRFESDQAIRKEWIEFSTAHKIPFDEAGLDQFEVAIAEKYAVLKSRLKDEDERNRLWLKGVIRKHGWPGKSLVGSQGAHNAWLLVQHASTDVPFQRDCLTKMEAMPKGEVSPIDIAYLTDRLLCGTGKKQKYGTQGMLKDGRIIPQPIEDEEHVDERRKELGLEPLADYLKVMEKAYGISKDSEAK